VANGDSEFGTITGNLSDRKNVPKKMWCYSENRVAIIQELTIFTPLSPGYHSLDNSTLEVRG
jgi:hypothetical protein